MEVAEGGRERYTCSRIGILDVGQQGRASLDRILQEIILSLIAYVERFNSTAHHRGPVTKRRQ